MPKNKVLFCKNCGRYRECLYKGRNGRLYPFRDGVTITLIRLINDKRPKFWKCTKCGEIFEEF